MNAIGSAIPVQPASTPQAWHVARHAAYQGQAAAHALRMAGFPAHALRTEQQRPGHDATLAPMFPGYLFVQFDRDNPDWTRTLRAKGVLGILSAADGRPLPLKPGCAEAFIDRCDAHGIEHAEPHQKPAKPLTRRGGLEILQTYFEPQAAILDAA